MRVCSAGEKTDSVIVSSKNDAAAHNATASSWESQYLYERDRPYTVGFPRYRISVSKYVEMAVT